MLDSLTANRLHRIAQGRLAQFPSTQKYYDLIQQSYGHYIAIYFLMIIF